jgi:hypothetical protein
MNKNHRTNKDKLTKMRIQILDFLFPASVRSWLFIGKHKGLSGIEQTIDTFVSTTRLGNFQYIGYRLQKCGSTTGLENDFMWKYKHGRLTGRRKREKDVFERNSFFS